MRMSSTKRITMSPLQYFLLKKVPGKNTKMKMGTVLKETMIKDTVNNLYGQSGTEYSEGEFFELSKLNEK